MAITSAIVLFAVIWFMALLIALPLGMQSQEESGDVVPGTPASAPVNPDLRKKVYWVTGVAFIVWIPLVWFLSSGILTVQDIDFFNRMGPPKN